MKPIRSKDLLFVTQIYHEKLIASQVKLKSFVREIQKESGQIYQLDAAGKEWSKKNYPNGYTSYSSQDQLHRLSSTFTDLDQMIQKHIARYLRILEYNVTSKQLKMTDCWLNIMPENTIHTAHIHPQSVLSGTFYVSAPKNASGLQFQDPRLTQFMNAPEVKTDSKIQHQRFITLKPKAGDLVLFESWLKHEVPLNKSKEPRISVSFNYDWN